MRPAIGMVVAAVIAVSACSEDGQVAPKAISPSCGLSTPPPSFDASEVPDGWLTEGAEAVGVTRRKDRLGIVMNLPYTVAEALSRYRAIVLERGFTIVSVDNEVFEAEVFFEDDNHVGSIQLRRSKCEDASLALVTVVDQKSQR